MISGCSNLNNSVILYPQTFFRKSGWKPNSCFYIRIVSGTIFWNMVDRTIVLVFVGPGILKHIKVCSQKFLSILSIFLNFSRVQNQCSEMKDFSFQCHSDWQSFQDNQSQKGSISCLSHSCHYSKLGMNQIFPRNMRKWLSMD